MIQLLPPINLEPASLHDRGNEADAGACQHRSSAFVLDAGILRPANVGKGSEMEAIDAIAGGKNWYAKLH